MTQQTADRVWETTATTGTGTYALAGAKTGYRAFSTVCANNDTATYAATDGTNWEVGLGTWTTGNNLARTTIYASSNSNVAVSWSAGTKDIFLDVPGYFFQGIDILDSRMSTAASDNSAALQAAINIVVAQATAASTAMGVQTVQIKHGIYAFTSGITMRPWTKLRTRGTVTLDFSTASTSVLAISAYNDGAPSGAFTHEVNAENRGPFLNAYDGALFINGPGAANTASIGLAIGDTSLTPAGDDNFEETAITGVTIANFGDGLHLRTNSLYMINFNYGGTLFGNNIGINTDNVASTVNSGERLSWTNWSISANNIGVQRNAPAMDMTFDNCSFDFNTTTFNLGVNDIFSKLTCVNCHLEGFLHLVTMDPTNTARGNFNYVTFQSSKIVTNDSFGGIGVPAAIFTGPILLTLENISFAGWENTASAISGLFMCDANVVILRANNIYFENYPQLISAGLLCNSDPYFGQGVVGNDLVAQPISTWNVDAFFGISAKVDNTHVLSPGTKAIEFTFVSNAGGNYYVITGDRFPVKPGDILVADCAVYGGTSTGGSISLQFIYSSLNAAIPVSVDGGSFGDTLSSIYGGGAQTSNAKMLDPRMSVIPAGVDFAQLSITVNISTGSFWLVFAGVNRL